MLNSILERIADDMERDYDFDFEQRDMALELLREYVPRFMNENRAEIQKLTNMYLEALLNDEPPTPEEVAGWAQRVLPLMERFQNLGETMAEDMRGFLTDEQLIRLEGNLEAFRTGMRIGTTHMQNWADGNYDPATEWIRSPEFEQKERERQRAAEREMLQARDAAMARVRGEESAPAAPGSAEPAPAAASPPPAPPQPSARPAPPAAGQAKDEWEAYVEAFCKRYEFSDDQRQAALRYLRGRQQERDRIKLRNADRLRRIGELFKTAKSPEELKKAENALKEANAPIERTFERLKEQLEKLPTAAQRRKVDGEKPAAATTQPVGARGR
ncbi:MAG: hypothetical protein LC135_02500 [Phycisphaerae bacterium]|nr:hypothetical protein [Phycisphaerae bacterium]MCZ2398724.1 hypothetical protein [Phycisphaerae bacterium]